MRFGLQWFNPGPPKGVFDDPRQEIYMNRVLQMMAREFREIHDTYSVAQNIIITLPAQKTGFDWDMTLPLQEFLADSKDLGMELLPSGAVVNFDITWAAAENMRGWAICDGTNGTKPIVPATVGGTQRIVRAVARGKDAGATAGAATHTHEALATLAEPSPELVDLCDDGDGVEVSLAGHDHQTLPETTSAASSLQPSIDLIPMMKQ